MLTSLLISDIVLIDRLRLVFRAGLGVLTGETGAGKSILLDGLALALGARGDAGMVRQGKDSGEVVAVFEPDGDHLVNRMLRDAGIGVEDQLILRRVQSSDGRTKAFVNDRPVSAQLLRDIGALLIEIHGQHDERAFVNPATHRSLLDAFGGLEMEARAVRETWQELRDTRNRLAAQEKHVADVSENRDYLIHVLDELEKLSPGEDEEDNLAARRTGMMQAEKVVGDLEDALSVLDGDGAYMSRISAVLRKLEKRVEAAPELLEAPATALDKAVGETMEARAALESAIQACAFDPLDLERAEERLFALRAAARKHNVQVNDLPAVQVKLTQDLSEIDAGEGLLTELRAIVERATNAYDKAASKLTKGRQKAAGALKKAVEGELEPLKLGQAQFTVHLEDVSEGSEHGRERAEFWVQTNPGTNPGPLMKIASGGELSRFILAVKVVLADKASAPTLIFDEIDTAISGAVADAVGRRLGSLSDKVQVLAVTHAPQVAARADHHYRIAKDFGQGASANTSVKELGEVERREEVARMLAGAEVTEEARAAADRLLSGAA
jgi:DNA repair protein RecN (Recombination protein N)